MSVPDRIVIVGASAAGLATAEALRRGGYDRDLVLVGDEDCAPYDRPPLSKKLLDGSWDPERTTLRSAEQIDALGAEWRLGVAAEALDLDGCELTLSDGELLAFDRLVVATGVNPRRLPVGEGLAGIHVMRTQTDSLGLRADLLKGGALVVVGAGPLGCETAATARRLGIETTVVDVLELPMQRQVGDAVGRRLLSLHESHGVRFHLGSGVSEVHGRDGRVSELELADGTRLCAATVLIAIGGVPATDWLQGSGVPLGNGVVCDEYCRATEDVYAVGDVAEWFNPRFGLRMRVEHRINANEQASAVAANILGRATVYEPIPYFWSDQYEVKLQAHGRLALDAEVSFEEHSEDGSRFAAIFEVDGATCGVLGWNIPKEMRHYREAVGMNRPAVAT